MIVRTQDLPLPAMAYLLWLVEDGEQHSRSGSMYYFRRRKQSIVKSNWRPWDIAAQATQILEDHRLVVWHDEHGWQGGSYISVTGGPVFFDAPSMAYAICLGAIGKHFGELVDVPSEFLDEHQQKPSLIAGMIARAEKPKKMIGAPA